MVHEAESRAVSEYRKKRQLLFAWCGFACAALLAGLESYGSSLMAVGPSDPAGQDAGGHLVQCTGSEVANPSTCNQLDA